MADLTRYRKIILNEIERVRGSTQSIPSLRQLAQTHSVPFSHLQSAAKALANEGKIVSFQRRGIFASGVTRKELSAANEKPESKRMTWKALRDRITMEIMSGLFDKGATIATIKSIQQRLGSNYQTTRKALGSLISANLLKRVGNHYIHPLPSFHKSKPEIVIINLVRDLRLDTMKITFSRQLDFYRYFTLQLSRSAINYTSWGYTFEPALQTYRFTFPDGTTSTVPKDSSSVFGYILMPWLLPYLDPLLHRLIPLCKPVSFWNDEQPAEIDKNLPNLLHYFKSFNSGFVSKYGEDMAGYLVTLGHRHFAFLSTRGKEFWSGQRFKGIKTVVDHLPGEKSLFLFTNDSQLQGWAQPSGKKHARNRIPGSIAPFTRFRPGSQTMIEESFDRHLIELYAYKATLPLFEKALLHKEVTAWICADDFTALMAIDFLRSKGITVPGRISIVGFDDLNAALRAELTSYNFNPDRLVRAMISHIVNFNSHPFGSAMDISIDGTVIERLSSGPAPKPLKAE